MERYPIFDPIIGRKAHVAHAAWPMQYFIDIDIQKMIYYSYISNI